jgi:hypothetical protein
MNFFDARRPRFSFFDVSMNVAWLGVGVAGFGYVLRRRCFIFCRGHRRVMRMTDGFSGKRLDVRAAAIGRGCHGRGFVRVAVIVVFEIFKNVADVQEGVAVQTDIHECRLHAG